MSALGNSNTARIASASVVNGFPRVHIQVERPEKHLRVIKQARYGIRN